MDFITTHAPKYPITINGTKYEIPRFLMREFAEFVEASRQKLIAEALQEIKSEEDRAKYRQYHPVPLVDVLNVARELTTPQGIPHVIRSCLKRGGVPDGEIEEFLENVDPELQRKLVEELRSGNGMIGQQAQASGEKPTSNPQTGQPHTSDGSPAITETTSQTSSGSSPAETPTA